LLNKHGPTEIQSYKTVQGSGSDKNSAVSVDREEHDSKVSSNEKEKEKDFLSANSVAEDYEVNSDVVSCDPMNRSGIYLRGDESPAVMKDHPTQPGKLDITKTVNKAPQFALDNMTYMQELRNQDYPLSFNPFGPARSIGEGSSNCERSWCEAKTNKSANEKESDTNHAQSRIDRGVHEKQRNSKSKSETSVDQNLYNLVDKKSSKSVIVANRGEKQAQNIKVPALNIQSLRQPSQRNNPPRKLKLTRKTPTSTPLIDKDGDFSSYDRKDFKRIPYSSGNKTAPLKNTQTAKKKPRKNIRKNGPIQDSDEKLTSKEDLGEVESVVNRSRRSIMFGNFSKTKYTHRQEIVIQQILNKQRLSRYLFSTKGGPSYH